MIKGGDLDGSIDRSERKQQQAVCLTTDHIGSDRMMSRKQWAMHGFYSR
jgi:hypothetical protein